MGENTSNNAMGIAISQLWVVRRLEFDSIHVD